MVAAMSSCATTSWMRWFFAPVANGAKVRPASLQRVRRRLRGPIHKDHTFSFRLSGLAIAYRQHQRPQRADRAGTD
jgi:hypothetical protein